MNFLINVVRKGIIPVAILACSGIVAFTYNLLDKTPLKSESPESTNFLPKAEYTKLASLGHSEAIASATWVNSLIEYGGSLYTGTEYRWLSQSADIVSTLDSLFYRTYYYLGALTPLNSEDTLDYKVMQRGVRVYPTDWRLALMLSMRYSQGPSRDFNRASELMAHYAEIDTIPEYVRQMSRSFKILGYPRKIALATLLEDYYNPAFAMFKKGVVRRMAIVLSGKDADLSITNQISRELPSSIESPQKYIAVLATLEKIALIQEDSLNLNLK